MTPRTETVPPRPRQIDVCEQVGVVGNEPIGEGLFADAAGVSHDGQDRPSGPGGGQHDPYEANGLALPSSAAPKEPNAARFSGVPETSTWQPSRAATRSPCHSPPGSAAATIGPATRSKKAFIAIHAQAPATTS